MNINMLNIKKAISLSLLLFSLSLLYTQNIYAEITVKLTVNHDGIYKVKGDDLANIGIELPISPETISLRNKGNPIPIDISNLSDGTFHFSSRIEFYGRTISRNDPIFKHTGTNVYILTLGGEKGKRMPQESAAPSSKSFDLSTSFKETVHAEENSHYATTILIPAEEDRWFWSGKIQAGQERLIKIKISHLSAKKNSCTIRARFFGRTNDPLVYPDHNTQISINDAPIGSFEWDGKGYYLIENHISLCPLISEERTNKKNIIKVYATLTTAAVDSIYLDWIEVDYWKEYKAENHVLRFNNPIEKETNFQIKGFQESSIDLFDITDAINNNIVRYDNFVVIQDQLEFAITQRGHREFYAVSESGKKTPAIDIYDAADLKNTGNQADYIIITHPRFITDLTPFVDHRESFSGLSILTVDINDVYDEFGYGLKDPAAIKEFLTYAYHNWSAPKPEFVLLIGDASIDPKNYIKNSFSGLIPTHLFNTFDKFEDKYSNMEVPTDNWFVTITPDDAVPDMMIGRLPVKTTEELKIIISKIITYETDPLDNAWNKNILFLTDNAALDMNPFLKPMQQKLEAFQKAEEEFNLMADHFSTFLPEDTVAKKIYLSDYLDESASTRIIDKKAGERVRLQMMEELKTGALMTTYIGHGSVDRWAAEEIFQSKNVSELENESKLTFLVGLNCLNGYFISPYDGTLESPSMAEAFLLEKDKGSVASWMPTWLGYRNDHKLLGEGLFKAIFEDGISTIGQAILSAKAYASERNVPDEVLNIFTLFGDPAMKLRMDAADLSNSPATDEPDIDTKSSDGGGGGGCFIATAAFGSGLETHVVLLKEFRDRYLLSNGPGRLFTRLYYKYSPPIAKIIAENEGLKRLTRVTLLPLIGLSFFMLKISLTLKLVISAGLISIIFAFKHEF